MTTNRFYETMENNENSLILLTKAEYKKTFILWAVHILLSFSGKERSLGQTIGKITLILKGGV